MAVMMAVPLKCQSASTRLHSAMSQKSCLGGVVVSVLATGPKGRRFEPSEGGGFLRAIKIHSTLHSDGK
jgi:hypothetical protein